MKIQIVSPDFYSPHMEMWHDYWIRIAATRAAEQLGHQVVPCDCEDRDIDIQLIFWGHRPKEIPQVGKYRAVWLESRVDEAPKQEHIEEFRGFDQIYTMTMVQQKALRARLGISSAILKIATDKTHTPANGRYQYDVAYMGTILPERVRALTALAKAGLRIVVAGKGWANNRASQQNNIEVVADLWPNDRFGDFYNMAPISIYPMPDHSKNNGLVPIKILDIFASSDCLCLTERNDALGEVFNHPLPIFSSEQEMIDQVRNFINNSHLRQETQRLIRQSIKVGTYQDYISQVVQDAKDFLHRQFRTNNQQ